MTCHLKYKDRTPKGRFSEKESMKIVDAASQTNSEFLYDSTNLGQTAEIWIQLGQDFDRTPISVYFHWKLYLQPLLTRYYC